VRAGVTFYNYVPRVHARITVAGFGKSTIRLNDLRMMGRSSFYRSSLKVQPQKYHGAAIYHAMGPGVNTKIVDEHSGKCVHGAPCKAPADQVGTKTLHYE
jgi:hypothetical protein